MTILDAYAVLALLKGAPAAAQVQQLIEAGDAEVTPIGVAEVLDHLVRVVGATEEEAVLAGALGRPLATSDPHLLDLCADEGIPVTVLPDSNGSVWSPGSA